MKSLVPPFPHRFDYLEIATANLAATESLFNQLGFGTTQVRETPLIQQKLMIQGRVRILLSLGAPGTYQHEYQQKNGDGICAISYHVDSAKRALHVLRQAKSKVVQEFITEEDEVMFLQSSAVATICDMRVIFVTRSGAPHDVLSPFAPHFIKRSVKPEVNSLGITTFADIAVTEGVPARIDVGFNCQDGDKILAQLAASGLRLRRDPEPGVELFTENPMAQILFHFKKI